MARDGRRSLNQWSLAAQFQDFSRGVLTFSGAAYFLMIVAVMLYLSMILIGRRHWRGGWQRQGMVLHYTVRDAGPGGRGRGPEPDPPLARPAGGHDQRAPQLALAADGEAAGRPEAPTGRCRSRPSSAPPCPKTYVQTRLNLLAHAPRDPGPRRRQGPRPGQRHRALQRGGGAGRAPLRHHRPAGGDPRPRRPRHRQHLPRRGHDLRLAEGRRALHRPGHPGRVRGGPLAVHGGRAEAEAGGHPGDRRPLVRRDELPNLHAQPQTGRSSTNCRSNTTWCRSTPASRSPSTTTCCWPCSPRRWAPRTWPTSSPRSAAGSRRPSSRTPAPTPLSDVPATSMPAAAPRRHEPHVRCGQRPLPKGDIQIAVGLAGRRLLRPPRSSGRSTIPIRRSPPSRRNSSSSTAAKASATPSTPTIAISAGLQQVLFPFPGWIAS